MQGLRELYDDQSGVVSRPQLLALGATDNDIARWLRRNELRRVYTGVYVNHTGPAPWVTRAWAAVLYYSPASLCDQSALDLAGSPIHVAIEHPRSARRLPGVRLHRVVDLDRRVLWNASPPRLRVEEAAIDVAATRSPVEAIALIGDLCQRRRTTPARLLRALEDRRRTRQGAWLRKVIEDVEAGALSVLEAAYLRRVERPHDLPRGSRQHRARSGDGVIYRDVEYSPYGVAVELDGRLGHELARDRWNDMDRDLLAVTGGLLPVRLGWRHVEQTPCRTAAMLAQLLAARGWTGRPRACAPACALSVGFRAPGAEKPTG